MEKSNNRKFDKFIMKVYGKCFSYNNLLQDIKFLKDLVKITVDVG